MATATSDDKPIMPTWKKWLFRLIFWGVIIGAVVAWPQGVGAVIAGGAILLLAIVFWVKYKIRKFLAPLQDIDLFPQAITLIAQNDPALNKPDLVADTAKVLESRGFRPIGTFTINKSARNYVVAFLNDTASAYAVLYDLPNVDLTTDIVSAFEDGSTFTCTNSPLPEILERPPGKLSQRHPNLDAGRLYQEFVKACPQGLKKGVSNEDFVTRFQGYHAELMAWNREQYDRRERLAQQLREEFLARSQWSAIDWDRKQNRVVFIHDELPAHDVVDSYMAALRLEDEQEQERERQRAESLVKQTAKTTAFERMIRESPHKVALENLMELTFPISANVYLSPEAD